MKTLLITLSIQCGLLCGASAAYADDCGEVSIGDTISQSSDFLSNLDKYILEKAYNCRANVSSLGTIPAVTSLIEKSEPNVVSEAWIDLLPDVVQKGIDDKKVELAASVFSEGGTMGFYIPKYVAEANPDIKTFSDALKHPELFPHPEGGGKGAIYRGPEGWGMTVATTQLYKAYDAAGKNFELVDTGSAAGLDGAIAKAYEAKQGWLGAYWSPTSLLAKYAMVKLAPDTDVDDAEWKRCVSVADCPDPKQTYWPTNRVYTIIATSSVEKLDPEIVKYLQSRSMTNDTMNEVLMWMSDNQATGEAAVKHFLQNYPAVWNAWVSADAKQKIEASL